VLIGGASLVISLGFFYGGHQGLSSFIGALAKGSFDSDSPGCYTSYMIKGKIKSTGEKVQVTGRSGNNYRIFQIKNGNHSYDWYPKDQIELIEVEHRWGRA